MNNRLLALIIFAGLLLLPVIVAATDRTPIPEATVEATPEATAEITPEPTPEATAEATAAVMLVGDAARGDELFHHGLNGAPACSNCHSTTTAGKGGMLAIGPGLKGIAERAATRVEGETAADMSRTASATPVITWWRASVTSCTRTSPATTAIKTSPIWSPTC